MAMTVGITVLGISRNDRCILAQRSCRQYTQRNYESPLQRALFQKPSAQLWHGFNPYSNPVFPEVGLKHYI